MNEHGNANLKHINNLNVVIEYWNVTNHAH